MQPADCKSPTTHPCSLVIEVVAGTGAARHADGPLGMCAFSYPHGLSRFGDSLIIVESASFTLRMTEGVLGVADPLAESKAHYDMSDYEVRAVPLIMTAVEVLPKELARMMAQYARHIDGRVHTITDAVASKDNANGHGNARRAAGELVEVRDAIGCVAVDTTDAVAGPQLVFGQFNRRISCLNMRTRMVKIIAGTFGRGPLDGPASQSKFGEFGNIIVAPTGALFVSEPFTGYVRRISAAKRLKSADAPAERMVTTLVGDVAEGVNFDRSAPMSFWHSLKWPDPMVLHAPLPPPSSAVTSTSDAANSDRDVGRLFVGCEGGVHAFDLEKGVRESFYFNAPSRTTGLALTDDGTRLFVVQYHTVAVMDTRTGVFTTLFGAANYRRQTTRCVDYMTGCVIDKATQSLVICDCEANQIVRFRGVDM